MVNTTTAARDVDPKVVSEIWDMLVLLNQPSRPCDIRNVVEDDCGEYKPPHVLRAILREMKEDYRKQ